MRTIKISPYKIEFLGDFSLKYILESGQIFRYYNDMQYRRAIIPYKRYLIKLKIIKAHNAPAAGPHATSVKDGHTHVQIEGLTLDDGSGRESLVRSFKKAVSLLLRKDLDVEYMNIIEDIGHKPFLNEIAPLYRGLRLLRQDPFECTFSFIVSQQSNIPRIKRTLERFTSQFGTEVIFEGTSYYLFPDRNELLNNPDFDEQTLREMGLGYRAKYLVKLVRDYPEILLEEERRQNDYIGSKGGVIPPKPVYNDDESNRIHRDLCKIYGIGDKIADCIQLFSFGDLKAFPMDTWMIKYMVSHFPDDLRKIGIIDFNKIHSGKVRKIRDFARQIYGKYAGYAQQFIYYHQISKPTKKESKKNKR